MEVGGDRRFGRQLGGEAGGWTESGWRRLPGGTPDCWNRVRHTTEERRATDDGTSDNRWKEWRWQQLKKKMRHRYQSDLVCLAPGRNSQPVIILGNKPAGGTQDSLAHHLPPAWRRGLAWAWKSLTAPWKQGVFEPRGSSRPTIHMYSACGPNEWQVQRSWWREPEAPGLGPGYPVCTLSFPWHPNPHRPGRTLVSVPYQGQAHFVRDGSPTRQWKDPRAAGDP